MVATDMKEVFFSRSFHYVPLVDVAIAHTALFACAALMVLRATLANPHRPSYVWIIFSCAVLEAIGYGARVHASENAALMSYIAQSFLILVVPIALALVNYIVVGKLLKATGKRVLCMAPQRIAKAFLISDIVCFVLQSGGSGMMTQASMKQMGEANTIAGIVMQLSFFTAFCILTYHIAFGSNFRLYDIPHLQPVFRALLTTSVLLYIRNIYRIAQFADIDGYVGTHEWLFDVFETFTIFLCFVAYAHWHFGRLLPYGEEELAELIATRGASRPLPCATVKPSTPLQLIIGAGAEPELCTAPWSFALYRAQFATEIVFNAEDLGEAPVLSRPPSAPQGPHVATGFSLPQLLA
jgi:hypothetical protein